MVHAAGTKVVAAYVQANSITGAYDAKKAVLIQPTHTLDIGNDIISGGAGIDMLVGDHGLITLPSIMVTRATPTRTLTATEKKNLDTALAAQDVTLTNALNTHLSRDHRIDASANAGANWLFGNQLGYRLAIGSDTIGGGTEDDVIIGDTALMEVPAIFQGYTSAQAKPVADKIRFTAAADGRRPLHGQYRQRHGAGQRLRRADRAHQGQADRLVIRTGR